MGGDHTKYSDESNDDIPKVSFLASAFISFLEDLARVWIRNPISEPLILY